MIDDSQKVTAAVVTLLNSALRLEHMSKLDLEFSIALLFVSWITALRLLEISQVDLSQHSPSVDGLAARLLAIARLSCIMPKATHGKTAIAA